MRTIKDKIVYAVHWGQCHHISKCRKLFEGFECDYSNMSYNQIEKAWDICRESMVDIKDATFVVILAEYILDKFPLEFEDLDD